VEDCGVDINSKGYPGTGNITPLGLAAFNGNMEVCKYLLLKGALVDDGYQPLIYASAVFSAR
jgi:ankyrin repeat protein